LGLLFGCDGPAYQRGTNCAATPAFGSTAPPTPTTTARSSSKTIYHNATTTQFAYDGPGNLTSVTDQDETRVAAALGFQRQKDPNQLAISAVLFDPDLTQIAFVVG